MIISVTNLSILLYICFLRKSCLSYSAPNSPTTVNLSLAPEDWNIYRVDYIVYDNESGTTPVIQRTSSGLRFYGSDYRQGSLIYSKLQDDFTDSTVNIKWQAYGGDFYSYSGFSVGINSINPDKLFII
jgi:hypothetical protein